MTVTPLHPDSPAPPNLDDLVRQAGLIGTLNAAGLLLRAHLARAVKQAALRQDVDRAGLQRAADAFLDAVEAAVAGGVPLDSLKP